MPDIVIHSNVMDFIVELDISLAHSCSSDITSNNAWNDREAASRQEGEDQDIEPGGSSSPNLIPRQRTKGQKILSDFLAF